MQLTVYFDGQFWVGLAEMQTGSEIRAARHVFGPEPASADVLAFVQRRLQALLDSVHTGVATEEPLQRPRNPKRAAREAARLLNERGGSTAAQEALRLAIESRAVQHGEQTRAERAAEAERIYALRRAKAKERHRGH